MGDGRVRCSLCAPEAASTRLAALQTWLDTHGNRVIIIAAGVVGLWLTGHSIYTLTTT